MKAAPYNPNVEFKEAIQTLAHERRIDPEQLYAAVEMALMSAYRRNYGPDKTNVSVNIDRQKGGVEVYASKKVADQVTDPQLEISLEEARQIQPQYEVGDIIQVDITPRDFGRIAAQTAKQVFVQKLREAERGVIYDEYIEKENEILTALVERVEPKQAYVEIGRTEGVLDISQQIPGETLSMNDHIKVYVLEVNKTQRGPQVAVSRIHPGLVKRPLEMEVPEIATGVVQIKSIAREAGSRTKMAVYSSDPNVDAVGACVGPRGTRVENVVRELRTEKIDIVKWSSDPAEYIANALSPARVVSVFISEKEKAARVVSVFISEKDKAARVIVPDNQLSLSIGKEGQNARLAAKLTGWKIDIKSQSQADSLIDGAAAEE